MNNKPASTSELEIVASILSTADAQAAHLLEAARVQADAERGHTQEEARAIESEILAKAEETILRHSTRELATAAVESRRMLLWAREAKIDAVFAQIEEGLQSLRADPVRSRQSLLTRAVEAVVAVGGDRVILQLAETGRPLVDDTFIDALKKAVQARGGVDVAIQLEFVAESHSDGCVASSPDGRVLYDNSWARRLERNRRAFRRAIVREIEHGHE